VTTRTIAPLASMALLLMPACHHIRIQPRDVNPATELRERTVHSTFWGLWSPNIAPSNCQGNGLAEVSTHTNILYAIVSVATLGFWQVSDVSWNCSKDRVP